jgi:hypothetical protein
MVAMDRNTSTQKGLAVLDRRLSFAGAGGADAFENTAIFP